MKKQETQNRAQVLINFKASPNYKREGYKSILKILYAEELKQKARARYEARLAEERAEFEKKLQKDIEQYGYFCMVVWSRDCDMCESTHVSRYESIEELEQSKEEAGEWAEGPVTWTYMDPREEEDFVPGFRDRAMEAFENGRGTAVVL